MTTRRRRREKRPVGPVEIGDTFTAVRKGQDPREQFRCAELRQQPSGMTVYAHAVIGGQFRAFLVDETLLLKKATDTERKAAQAKLDRAADVKPATIRRKR